MGQTKVANKSEVQNGQNKVVNANGKSLAIFNVNGKFYCTDNTCLHRGGPLGEGTLEGNTITCPWHGWQYDVTSGECKTATGLKLKTYNVEVKGEEVFVEL